ncbi:MAG: 23S rRNA (pseudouridine(1915)-N(3))-methyltransferase RlmH [Deltaproteobacteria bacterium]|nr:23S rRNA (pseudouridine(1915)-N(3))-methyltransferase RlmH [Deltaproteobacteria bacterium]
MKTVQIWTVGRHRDATLKGAGDEYFKRASRSFKVEEREARDLPSLLDKLPARDALIIALDERGPELTSLEFARLVADWLEGPAQLLALVIGPADGLDDLVRRRAHRLLALSKMTLAHRVVRLVLAEQLYRAASILQGSPYHREG